MPLLLVWSTQGRATVEAFAAGPLRAQRPVTSGPSGTMVNSAIDGGKRRGPRRPATSIQGRAVVAAASPSTPRRPPPSVGAGRRKGREASRALRRRLRPRRERRQNRDPRKPRRMPERQSAPPTTPSRRRSSSAAHRFRTGAKGGARSEQGPCPSPRPRRQVTGRAALAARQRATARVQHDEEAVSAEQNARPVMASVANGGDCSPAKRSWARAGLAARRQAESPASETST